MEHRHDGGVKVSILMNRTLWIMHVMWPMAKSIVYGHRNQCKAISDYTLSSCFRSANSAQRLPANPFGDLSSILDKDDDDWARLRNLLYRSSQTCAFVGIITHAHTLSLVHTYAGPSAPWKLFAKN